MERQEFFDRCREVFSLNGIPLTGGEEELSRYYSLALILTETNKKMNLTAIKDLDSVIVKHIADSLILLNYIKDGDNTVADVGCGGGFPTLPCAVAAAYRFPSLSFVGIDSTKKKGEQKVQKVLIFFLPYNINYFIGSVASAVFAYGSCSRIILIAFNNLFVIATCELVPTIFDGFDPFCFVS